MTLSVIDLIDQLEGLMVNGRRLVFTANVMVNEDEALDLIDRARMELPDEIKRAHLVVEEQQRLINEAEEAARAVLSAAEAEADRLLAAARDDAQRIEHGAAQRAATLVSETEVLRAANAHAQELVADAERVAATTREQADAYARDVMSRLSAQLQKMVATVQKGVDALGPQ